MDFQTGALFGYERAHFKHVSLKDSALLAVEIKGIVFEERTSAALRHHPYGAVEGCALPVAFGTETVAFGHQALRCQSGDLVEAVAGFVDVYVAEVIEICCETFRTLVGEYCPESKLGFGGVPYFAVSFGRFVFERFFVVIFFEVCFHECIHVGVGYFVEIGQNFTERTVVDMVAHAYFRFNLVAVGNGYIIHLVAESEDKHVLRVCPCHSYTLPYGDAFQSGVVFPVAGHYFAAYAHARADMPEFAVAMGALVKVHEVHVHGFPGNFRIVLGVEVKHGLVENLQAVDPHLCGRECVHPCDYAGAARIVVGGSHKVGHFTGRVGCSFINDFYGELARIIQAVDHLF